MSMQWDLQNPELGYFDEGKDLADLSTYAAALQPFGMARTLPSVAYRSKAFLELENEKVWTRSWVAIGLLQQIPNPGDLLPFTAGFAGVHVQRNHDGSISARMNRHQHGGCRFVPQQCRSGVQTKCSITSCNYTRDSDVMAGGENGENTDLMYKFLGFVPEKLASVRCETLGPLIFINLDPEAPPLSDCLAETDFCDVPDLPDGLRLEHKQWSEFQCNWKAVGKAFSQREAAQDVKVHWLFPNVLMAVHATHVAIILLQATGVKRCLCRVFVLSTGSASSSECVADLVERWKTNVAAGGAAAEAIHAEIAGAGTSLRPGTETDDCPVETNPASHRLSRFLVGKLTRVHQYHWNAPIMDAALLMRK